MERDVEMSDDVGSNGGTGDTGEEINPCSGECTGVVDEMGVVDVAGGVEDAGGVDGVGDT